MLLILVQSPDALFECQQGFAYLGSIDSCLLIMTVGIPSPLISSQINKAEKPGGPSLSLQMELKNGVGSGALLIFTCRAGNSERVALGDALEDLLGGDPIDHPQTHQSDVSVLVFSRGNLASLIQQIKELSAVDFKVREFNTIILVN